MHMSNYKLLEENDLEPFRIERENTSTSQFVIVCDHAGQNFPKKLNNLGLPEAETKKHITYDIGTEEVGSYIGEKLDAITFIAHYSRLVADVNRGPTHSDFMMPVSDGIQVPGNKNISDQERQARIDEVYNPYQNTIRSKIDERINDGKDSFMLSIHSFTPEMNNYKRPWEIGILWMDDDYRSQEIILSLQKNNPDMCIGDNQPYSLKEDKNFNNTVELQATSRGIPSMIVEIRQDMIDTPAKAQRISDVFLESFIPLF